MLIIPLLTAVVLAGLRAQTELQRQQEFELNISQLEVGSKVATLVNNLQRERLIAVGRLAGVESEGGPTLEQQARAVDASVDQVRQATDQLAEDDPTLADQYRLSLARLDSLSSVRGTVSNRSVYPPISLYEDYTSIVSDLVQLDREVSASVTDRDLLREASVTQSMIELKEYASGVDALLLIGVGQNSFSEQLLEQTQLVQASFDGTVGSFRANATPEEDQFYTDTFSGPDIDDRERIRQTALTRDEAGDPLRLGAEQLYTNAQTASERLRTVETNLQNTLSDNASVLAKQARDSALRDSAIVLAALLAALILVVLVVRSLLKPLRVLRTSALDVAYRSLPDEVDRILADPDPIQASKNAVQPVPVFTSEETGQVARSFDEVHNRAVQLAAEQALLRDNVNAMLVNLSRRSQALVERQLGLIDRLESDEQDPDQLSNLFELDHLATRMRRNSENLLVLSGTELGRRLSKPVPVSDVVGAAVSETDQYARVDVRPAPQAAVAGPAVNDVVHLIAELLDNATAYSSPDTQVTVRSATGRKGTLAIEVIDRGVGVDETELARLNERLANPPELDVSVSRRMGLFVVATLARRHAIQVQLRENLEIEGGVVAKVVLPAALVTELAVTPMEATGERSAPRQRSAAPGGTTDYFAGANGSGTFPPIGADEPGMASPAMTSNGIAGAFDASGNRNGSWAAAPNGNQAAADYDHPPMPEPEPQPEPQPEPEPPAPEPEPMRGGLGEQQHELPPPPPADQSLSLNGSRGVSPADGDVPTDRLPIYEEVLSQWFSTSPETPASQSQPQAEPTPEPAEPPAAAEEQAPVSSGLPKRVPGSKSSALPKRQEKPAPEPTEPAPQAGTPSAEREWSSPADGGWQAAQALLQPVDEMTTAGLPKRRPKAHLVPGSAAVSPTPAAADATQKATAPSLVPRSADAVRGRMSSLQQGVARGRHALIEAGPDGAPNSADDVNSSYQERQ